ncbi:MAG: tetratricopeptide repeat protein [Desulfobulbaceae bacterium]|nr:tetratricopeptide repeat protein [Desulfobulbaceae bacterium]
MRIFFLFSTLLFISTTALAAPPEEQNLFQQGRAQFEAGNFSEAYELLHHAFRENPGNLDISFYLGRAAFEKGDYEAAVMAFERILIMDPNPARIKLELGRCYFSLGSYGQARQYFDEVLATEPPPAVRQNIEMFLERIVAADKRHFLSGTVAVGVSADDNARSAPSTATIQTVLGDFTLTGATAAAESDTVYNMTVSLNHTYKMEDQTTAWKTSVINYNDLYSSLHDLDINFFGLNTGPARQDETSSWEMHGILNYLEIDGDRYLESVGGGTTLALQAAPWAMMNFGLKMEYKKFFQDAAKNAKNTLISLGPLCQFGSNRLGIFLSHENETASVIYNSYSRNSAQFSYERKLPFLDLNLLAGCKYQKTEYRFQPLFGKNRTDELRDYSAVVSKPLWMNAEKKKTLTLNVNYTYSDVRSNIGLYDYDKHVASSSLAYSF